MVRRSAFLLPPHRPNGPTTRPRGAMSRLSYQATVTSEVASLSTCESVPLRLRFHVLTTDAYFSSCIVQDHSASCVCDRIQARATRARRYHRQVYSIQVYSKASKTHSDCTDHSKHKSSTYKILHRLPSLHLTPAHRPPSNRTETTENIIGIPPRIGQAMASSTA
jgi:hypothetical protein